MAYDLYLSLKGSQYTKVAGVTAESAEDVVNYDNSNYRNLLGADVVGRAWNGVATTFPPVSPALFEAHDDRVNATVPFNEAKKRTRTKWTTALGLYWAWDDQIIALSNSPFGFAGSTLPAAFT